MSLPTWTALHAYLVGGRVTPVSPNATVWSVQIAGTSGAAQPTWPTQEPWTVVDGTVTWMLASAFRQNAVAAVVTTLTNFKLANPTLLAQVSSAKPANLSAASCPLAYVIERSETIPLMNAGLRTRMLAGLGVAVVDVTPSPTEAEARMDILMDGLVDAFTAAYHAVSGYSILQPLGSTPFDPADGSNLIGEILSLGSTFVTEGRQ